MAFQLDAISMRNCMPKAVTVAIALIVLVTPTALIVMNALRIITDHLITHTVFRAHAMKLALNLCNVM